MRILLLVLLFSCSNRNLGYRVAPLEGAYYPRRVMVNLGAIVLVDIQIVKR